MTRTDQSRYAGSARVTASPQMSLVRGCLWVWGAGTRVLCSRLNTPHTPTSSVGFPRSLAFSGLRGRFRVCRGTSFCALGWRAV